MLGEKIKAGRHGKGLSQQEFADMLSVVRQTVSKWEKGLSVPDSDMLVKIAEILEVSVTELLSEDNTPTLPEVTEQNKKGRALPLTLIIIGSPVWLALGISALAVVISLYAALWCLAVSAWAVFGALVGGGAGGVVGGIIITLMSNTTSGLALLGAGFLSAGLSIFAFFGSTAATKGAVWLSKLPFVITKKLLKRGGGDE